MEKKISRSRILLVLFSILCIVICAVSVTSFTASADTVKLPGKTFTSGECYQLNQAITKPEGDDGSITFETEIFIPEAYRNDRGVIISTYDGSTKNNFAFEINGSVSHPGQIRVFSHNYGSQVYLSENITQEKYMGTDANPKFVKIAITVNTNPEQTDNNIKLYINGEFIKSISNTSLKSDTYYPDHNPVICIGNDTRPGGLPFKGTMKNVAMYRGVRTAAQISADHKASFYDTTDANLLFALDGTGSDARSMEDKSANHNHALNVNYSAPDDGNTFSASELFRLRNNITPDGPITFETEIYIPEAQRSQRTGVILSNYQGDANLDAWAFELGSSAQNSAGKIRVYSRTKGDVLIDYDVTQDMGTDAAPKYAKIAVTVDTTNGNIVLYVNGIKKATATNSHSGRAVNMYNTEKGRLWIGGDGRNGNDAYFKGKIRNVALYKGVRTEAEILLDCARSFYDTTDKNLLFAHDLTSVRLGLIEDKSQNENHANSNKYDGRAFSSTDDPLHTVKDYTEAPLTYEALIYAPTGIDRTGVILGNYPDANGNCINFEVYHGGKPSLFIYENGALRTNYKFGFDVRQDKWVHLAISMENVDNKDTLFKCYVDGELVDSYTQTGYVYTLDMKQLQQIGQISIGRDVRNDKVFAGRIRNVAIHNKTLTADEIKDSYKNGVNVNKSSFIACYEMPNEYKDGLASTTIKDTSGNGYDMQHLFYEKDFTTKDYDYSFAVVGDTQFMVYQDAVYGTNYTDYIYNWIVNNYDAKKMKYVIGVGDIIDNGKWPSGASLKDDEWAYAKQLITRTLGKNNIPYSLIGGNHDYMRPHDTGFNATFGNETSLTKNITGYYQKTDIYNYYMNFEVEGTPYMLLALEYGANDDILAWANNIVAANSDRRVIVTTHGYMNFDGTTLDGNDHAAPRPAGSTDANTLKYNNGDDMWEKFIRKHANIAIVLSGHIDYNNVVMREDKGDHGNTVHQFLIDPQRMDRSYGFETGMVAMLYFRNGGKDVSVEYVSTYRTANNNNKEVLFNTRNQFGFTIKEATETEYGDIPEEQTSTVDYPVVLFNSAKTYIGAYQTVKAAATEAMKKPSGNYVILLRNDLTQSDGLYISNLTGSITLDLGGHTLTKAEKTYLFECYYGGGAFDGGKLTVKNGYLVNKGWSSFFCYNYGASLSGDVDFDFEFDNVSFRSDYTAETGKTVVLETWDNGGESKGAIYSNVVFNDCVFDYTGKANGEVMLSLTNGATRAIFNVSVNGGKIISDRTVNAADFVEKDNSDTVRFGRSANGYTACTLPSGITISENKFDASNGAKLSYSLGVVSNGQLVYTLGEDVNTEYGIIPYKYTDVNVYPFVVFRNGKCVHASSYFGRDNEESALSRGKENGTVILMRRDFVYKESQYNNLSHANTIVIDLGGFTFTSTDRVVFSTQKKTTNDSIITLKNGTFILGSHAFMKLSTWDPSSLEDGGSVNNPPYKGGNGFYFVFEDISIELTKGATTSNVICFNRFDVYKYHPTMFCNMTFNNCTFDLTASEKANLTMFNFSDNHCTAKAYFNGGTIKANSLKFLDSANAHEESFLVFGEAANGYTVLSIPEGKIAAGSGDTYSTVDGIKFKRVSESDGYVNYTLCPEVSLDYKVKTNVTLYTNFVYNIYLPADEVVAFVVSCGDTTISKSDVQVTDGYYHVALNIPAAETLLDVKVTAVLRDLGGYNVTADWSLGIFEYSKAILEGPYTDISKTLIKDMLVYSYRAHKYFGGYGDSVAAKLTEIESLVGSYYKKLPSGNAQTPSNSNYITDVTLSLGEKPAFRFYVAEGKTASSFVFSYDGKTVSSDNVSYGTDAATKKAFVEVNVFAYAMLDGVSISYGNTSVGTYNLYAYYDYVTSLKSTIASDKFAEYAKLVSIVEGLMKYSASANDYKTYIAKGDSGYMSIYAPDTIYANSGGFDITVLFTNGSYYGNVTWTTDHPNVYVQDGKIYAVGTFENMTKVTITATTEHHTASKEITVINRE